MATRYRPPASTHLGQEDVLELTSLFDERLVLACIADEQVFEDSTVRSVGHFVYKGGRGR